MSGVFRVGQLSDTHFVEPGFDPEGTHSYDTSDAFDAVLADLRKRADLDTIVVTGDIADHGRPEQYAIAASAFARLPVPVVVCPGNHDFDDTLRHDFDAAEMGMPRVTNHGSWTFVYVDSNAGRMVADGTGRFVDPPGDERLHANGALGERESAWLRDVVTDATGEHVFVWLHHPPDSNVPLAADAGYTAEWSSLIVDLTSVRGFGAGHTHVPSTYEFAGRPVFVSPSLKNNFDLEANTWLPPGYRTYEFHPDGTVISDLHLVDDERWPRRPFGRALRSLFMGELTYEELAAIAARRGR